MIAWFLTSRVGRWLAAGLTIAGTVSLLLIKVFSVGKKSAASAQRDAELRAVREAREVEDAVNSMTSDARRDELAKWSRK